jgi:hypothetical protein
MDSVVLSWLHDTITVELQDIICDEANTSRQAWLALEEQFLENQDARVPRRPVPPVLSRGSLRGEYCHQMKGMTNSLRDLGEPVADRTLVLNLMCGLSLRYGHLKALIKRTVPFPTFDVVRNELLLEELTMVTKAPAPAPTLYSAPPGGQAPSVGQAPRPASTEPPACRPPVVSAAPRAASTADRGRRPRKGDREGDGHAWSSFYNPWTGTISMWSGQVPSVSHPPASALLTAPPNGVPPMPPYGVPPASPTPPQLPPSGTPTSTPWSPLAGGWDHASLVAAFSTMVMAPPSFD